LITAEAKFFRFSKTNLSAAVALFPAISDPGRVRANTNASFYVKLFSDLKWNVTWYATGTTDHRQASPAAIMEPVPGSLGPSA
jgi:hypothetical protein